MTTSKDKFESKKLPMMPIRDVVIFPFMMTPFVVGRESSVRALEEAVVRHYCESLFLGVHLPCNTTTIVDVGSGAGFPGLPIAVLRSEAEVTLVESHQRKAVFLREAARGLSNVRVLASRAHAVTDRFDIVVSRAVRPMGVVGLLPKLANRVALLVGEADADSLRNQRQLDWEDPVRLPWGDRRVLLRGECST